MRQQISLFLKVLALLLAMGSAAGIATAANEYSARQLVKLSELAEEAERVLGAGWTARAVSLSSNPLPNGIGVGRALDFSSNQIQVNGSPATFRVAHVGWGELRGLPVSGPDAYVPFSAGKHGYWYYSPGSYGITHPEQFDVVLHKLHTLLGLPVADEGLVCLLEPRVECVMVGEPVAVGVRLTTLPGANRFLFNDLTPIVEHLIVTGPSGNILPLKKKSPRPELVGRSVERGQKYMGETILSEHFDMNTPGVYRVKLLCPFGADGHKIAESQEITIGVLPAGFMSLRLVGDYKEGPLTADSSLPVELELEVKEGLGLFPYLDLSLSASKVGSVSRLYGSLSRQMSEDILRKLDSTEDGCHRLRLDLSEAKWNKSHSSSGPMYSIWSLTNPAEEWRFWATLSGEIDGRAFVLTSNELHMHVDG